MQHKDVINDHDTPWIIKRIGFRTMSSAMSDSNDDSNKEGSGTFGTFFKASGATSCIHGESAAPSNQLEGRTRNHKGREIHVKLIALVRMSMLRAWGSGSCYL